MSSKIITASVKDMRMLFREKTFTLILAIFILMGITSTYIGWSSQHTIQQVYDETARELMRSGNTAPPSPLSSISPLSLMKNMIIYMVLIGSILAIILGHSLLVNDRKSNVTKIIFSRPFSKKEYLLGKIVTVSAILLFALILSMVLSTIPILILSAISMVSVINMLVFYSVSFIFLAGFACLGVFFGLKENNSTKAILLPMIIWILIIFALPELGSALYPTSSLNPILPETRILDSQSLKIIHTIIYPLSISEQYKEFSANTLGISSSQTSNISAYPQLTQLIILLAWLITCLGLSYHAITKFDASSGDNYE